jgi:hypothetical protein
VERNTQMMYRGLVALGSMMAVLLGTMAACSSDKPKPMAQPSPDQVRGHADHAFDKLKEEEKERTPQPPAP